MVIGECVEDILEYAHPRFTGHRMTLVGEPLRETLCSRLGPFAVDTIDVLTNDRAITLLLVLGWTWVHKWHGDGQCSTDRPSRHVPSTFDRRAARSVGRPDTGLSCGAPQLISPLHCAVSFNP